MDYIDPATGETFEDIDIEIEEGPQWPLVPDGVYQAKYLGQEPVTMRMWGNSHRLYAHFEIIDPGPYMGKRLFGSWPLGTITKDGNGKRRLVAKRHGNLAAMLKRLFGKAARITRASLSSLRGQVIEVRTCTVKTDPRQRAKPECEWYSKVDEIVALCAGDRA